MVGIILIEEGGVCKIIRNFYKTSRYLNSILFTTILLI